MTHTLRKRFRSTVRDLDTNAARYLLGWTLVSRDQSQDARYLPVEWPLLLEVTTTADERLAVR